LFGVFSYAIIRQKLLDTGKLLNQGITYFLATTLIVLFYGACIVIAQQLLRTQLTNMWVLGITVILVPYGFIPLKDALQNQVNRWMRREPHRYRDALLQLAKELPLYVDPASIEARIQETLRKTVGIDSGIIMEEKTLRIRRDWVLVLAMKTAHETVGQLCLGPKDDGEKYDTQDIALFEAVAGQAAIALHNATLIQALKTAHQRELQSQKQSSHAQRLASLGTISAGLAHELKNPLSALLTMTKLLKDRFQDEEFRHEFMDIVPRQVERMNDLIKSLLTFAKPQELRMQLLVLNQLLLEVLKLTAALCRSKQIEVDLSVPDSCQITGDENQLIQVFLNLILNAVEAMPQGGTLTITAKTATDGRMELTFSDTGQGICNEHLNRIFDPFYTTKPEGTGLGLATSWQILKAHNAEIRVQSEEGKGTVFKIQF
jgi:signal transduction histidine kinase